jgi:predicted SnoaL-like aldol condensation-catalyzing enzyme
VTTTPDNEFSGQAKFDLFRFNQEGLIVEHWGTIQDVPATSASGNSMFSTFSPDGPEPVTQQQEDENRSLLINLLDRLFNERDFSVLDQYWSEEYLQHNPQARNGPAALKAFLEHLSGLRSSILYALADGNYVLTFGHGTFPGHDPSNEFVGVAAIDLYHMVDGKVAEHWDVLQNVPATSVNGNSMFSSLSQG